MLTADEKNSFLVSLANNEKNINIQLMKKLNQIQKGVQKVDAPKKRKK